MQHPKDSLKRLVEVDRGELCLEPGSVFAQHLLDVHPSLPGVTTTLMDKDSGGRAKIAVGLVDLLKSAK